MKFLADENFSKPILRLIVKAGYSVKTIQQKSLQGSSDNIVATIAFKEKRIVLTFDKDFLINQPEDLRAVIFDFPRTPTSEIIPLMKGFLRDVKIITRSKYKIFKFNKSGLAEV